MSGRAARTQSKATQTPRANPAGGTLAPPFSAVNLHQIRFEETFKKRRLRVSMRPRTIDSVAVDITLNANGIS